MALRPFLSRNLPNLFPSTAAMSSLLFSPPPQPQQPLLVHRRTYSSSNPTAIEFTQGGPASLGSHVLQPETIQSEPTTTWANVCPTSNELLYTTTFTDQHQYSCDCPEFQLQQHTCRHVDHAKQSIIQMKLNAQQEELDAQQEELDVRRAELTHADTILLEAATNPATSSSLVVGIDEAGAGPVIGPMIFCAVVLSKDVEQHLKQQGVKDSKDVPPKKRGLLREVIMEECIEYNTIVVHAQDIDRRRKGGESMNDIKVQAVSDLLSNIQTNEVTTAYIDAFDNVGKRVWLVVVWWWVVGGGWWVVGGGWWLVVGGWWW
jgi:hypothetical protein